MKNRYLLAATLGLALSVHVRADEVPLRVGKFIQEVAHKYGDGSGLPSTSANRVAVASDGAVFAATAQGLALFANDHWSPVPGSESKAWTAVGLSGTTAYAAAGEEIFQITASGVTPFSKVGARVTDLTGDGKSLLVGTEKGLVVLATSGKLLKRLPDVGHVAQVATRHYSEGADTDAVATRGLASGTGGAYWLDATGRWSKTTGSDDSGAVWGAGDVLGVAAGPGLETWYLTKAGVIESPGPGPFHLLSGKDGLPYNDFTCAAAGPNGEVWFGTKIGAIRYDGKDWEYRQGKAWLLDDSVSDIDVDAQGGAWIATAKGVSYIERRPMTLAEKAKIYEEEVEKYIKRTPFGYTSEVDLKAAGDRASGVIQGDSDNDGLWTSMYGAGECFAYAATKSPEAKDRAKKAFEALRFLQKVTQGGEHSPPKGYVARTIRSVDDPDPNIGRLESDKREQAESDKAWKVYEPRWPKSADGKWYWKSDTSSDELDGHYFFYPLYYDLVADTEEEKDRVREVVRDLTDHFLKHDFNLIDHDGTPTRWAVYSPSELNENQRWWPERGLNSLSMLSYLTVADHMTGDPKYMKAFNTLVKKHHYLQNLNFTKMQWGAGTANQSDDEMAIMSFYNLLRYTKDEEVRNVVLYAFYRYYMLEAPEMNPFFNFAYAAVGLNKTITDNWGTWPVTPFEGWLGDSMDTLQGFSLDRCNWARKNSHRIDLLFYPFGNASEPYSPDTNKRGYRYNGKCIPVSERFFNHWNTDPWELNYGGDGRGLASGAVYLLPYYMGLYHGFIEETK